MAVFVVLWPYLLTTKLSCLQKNNFGHTVLGMYNFAAIVILVPYLRLLIAVPWSSDPLTPYVALDEELCSLFIEK